MSENVNQKMRAIRAYKTICAALDDREWKYRKFEDDLTVTLSFSTDGLPMELFLAVDEERQLVRLLSRLPMTFPEDKRVEGALATLSAAYSLVDGSFDFDLGEGKVTYRQVVCFHNSELSKAAVYHLMDCAYAIIKKYSEKLFAVSKGYLPVTDFVKEAYE